MDSVWIVYGAPRTDPWNYVPLIVCETEEVAMKYARAFLADSNWVATDVECWAVTTEFKEGV